MRNTIIFGNGLGMALSADHFCLTNALGRVWSSAVIDDDSKRLISNCIPGGRGVPNSEDDLDTLHIAITACNFLSKIGDVNSIH
ncbi:hypothetical protein [Chromobacterium violaceum]|uniref:hypothetical protein n=1 Tax=Chromobacterium violaceum TaxID=536 RepID=UPI00194E5BC6|nr:hypothetical protein [Chromobacterium violaceum]MBX9268696.1 hypothetical protein [Chromobacterium violaceum]QRO35110.1 hypothetical protein I6K04_10550 [Chromobacterium violaceum]QRQ15085.1 hypothetical protein I6K03_12180 [Chromobacterium violaceum]